MNGPDIPQIEVLQSMDRIREAASKTQEAPAPAKILKNWQKTCLLFSIKLFPVFFS